MIEHIITYFQEHSDKFNVYHEVIWAKGKDNINTILYYEHNLKSDKIKVFFIVDDHEHDFNRYDNQIIIRTSMLKSRKHCNEVILPYIWESIPIFEPLKLTDKPIIGFCGLNSGNRTSTINECLNCNDVQCNFILRNQFWGGKPHDSQLVEEFRNNIKSSHYIICNRGNGNFSMRFYQTLSAGRIPILINTDMELPFENLINWSNYIIMANTNEELIHKVIEHYKTANIIDQQQRANMYLEYFSNDNYPKHLLNYLNANYNT